MASAPSPVAGFLQQLIASKLGGQGGAGGMEGANPEALGQAVGQQYSELQNVDPGKIVQDLQAAKAQISAMFPIAVMRVADAAKGISQAVVGLNAAIKAFEKAQQTQQTLQQSPLGMSAAQSPGPGQPPAMGNPGGMTL